MPVIAQPAPAILRDAARVWKTEELQILHQIPKPICIMGTTTNDFQNRLVDATQYPVCMPTYATLVRSGTIAALPVPVISQESFSGTLLT